MAESIFAMAFCSWIGGNIASELDKIDVFNEGLVAPTATVLI